MTGEDEFESDEEVTGVSEEQAEAAAEQLADAKVEDGPGDDDEETADQAEANAAPVIEAMEQEQPAAEPSGNPLINDPYDYERCTISIQITLLPSDGDPRGREAMLAVRNHQDAPILRYCRAGELALSGTIESLLEELRGQLAERGAAKAKRDQEAAEAKAKAEESARKSRAEADANRKAAEAKRKEEEAQKSEERKAQEAARAAEKAEKAAAALAKQQAKDAKAAEKAAAEAAQFSLFDIK